MQSAPDPIDPLLDRWRNVPAPQLSSEVLSHEVWRRIAEAEIAAGAPTFWGRIESAFARPSFALAFVAACTLFGLFLAELRVSHLQAQRNVQLAQAYIQLIDPLLQTSAAPAHPRSQP